MIGEHLYFTHVPRLSRCATPLGAYSFALGVLYAQNSATKMVFTVLGAVAELERAIIRERVIAGQKAAKRRGVRFGRPNVAVPLAQIEKLRQKGLSWRVLEAETGIAKDTLRRAFMALQSRSRSRT